MRIGKMILTIDANDGAGVIVKSFDVNPIFARLFQQQRATRVY